MCVTFLLLRGDFWNRLITVFYQARFSFVVEDQKNSNFVVLCLYDVVSGDIFFYPHSSICTLPWACSPGYGPYACVHPLGDTKLQINKKKVFSIEGLHLQDALHLVVCKNWLCISSSLLFPERLDAWRFLTT